MRSKVSSILQALLVQWMLNPRKLYLVNQLRKCMHHLNNPAPQRNRKWMKRITTRKNMTAKRNRTWKWISMSVSMIHSSFKHPNIFTIACLDCAVIIISDLKYLWSTWITWFERMLLISLFSGKNCAISWFECIPSMVHSRNSMNIRNDLSWVFAFSNQNKCPSIKNHIDIFIVVVI